MEAEDTEDLDEDEESEAEEDLHLDMDEGETNAKNKVMKQPCLIYDFQNLLISFQKFFSIYFT